MKTKLDASERLSEVLAEEPYGERALRTILAREEYSEEEIGHAVSRVKWDEQAALAYDRDAALQDTHQDLLILALQGRGFTEMQAREAALRRGATAGRTKPGGIWPSLEGQTLESVDPHVYHDLLSGVDEDLVRQALAGDRKAQLRTTVQSLLYRGISRSGLKNMLEAMGYDAQEIRRQIQENNPNWKQQAVRFAEHSALSMDREEVQDSLRDEGFTPVQVAYAMNTAHIDDAEAARAAAQRYMEVRALSLDDLKQDLQARGLSPEDVQAGVAFVEESNPDWEQAGGEALRLMLHDRNFQVNGPAHFREAVKTMGYTDAQVDIAYADMNWARRAASDYIIYALNSDAFSNLPSSRQIAGVLKEMGYDAETAAAGVEVYWGDQTEQEMVWLQARIEAVLGASPARIRAKLAAGGHEPEQIEWYVSRIFNDPLACAASVWNDETSKLLAQGIIASPLDMRSTLEEEGFDEATIAGLDEYMAAPWPDIAGMYAISLWADELGTDEIREEMLEEGFAPADVNNALESVVNFDVERAQEIIRSTALLMRRKLTLDRIEHLELEAEFFENSDDIREAWEQLEAIDAQLGALGPMDIGYDD